jgi:hypothetical protein
VAVVIKYTIQNFLLRHVAIFLALSSCVGGLNRGGAPDSVVEKSRLVRPSWIEQEPNQFVPQGNYLQFVAVKKNQANLTLGIRQSRDFAIYSGEIALIGRIKAELQKIPGVNEFQGSEFPVNHLEALILHELDQDKGHLLTVSDIYYEKWRSTDASLEYPGNSELFDVFVLVRVDADRVEYFTSNLTNSLQVSGNPKIRHLAEIIKKYRKFAPSH